jgi:lysophospholipase L1-like esterase
LDRLHETTMLRPGWVFVQAGINDLAQGSAPEELVARLSKIWARIALESPGTRVGVLNLLPLCPGRFEWTGFSLNNPLIRRVNAAIQEAASRSGALYLDLYAAYADPKGDLPENYTQDGLNLLPEAYGPWTELLITVLQKEGLSRGAASREGGSAGGGEEPARGA